jgi:hypothetical protein
VDFGETESNMVKALILILKVLNNKGYGKMGNKSVKYNERLVDVNVQGLFHFSNRIIININNNFKF